MAADDIYQVIGFLLEAKDLASPAMLAAQVTLATITPKIEAMFSKTVGAVDTTLNKFASGVGYVEKVVKNAVITAPMKIWEEVVTSVALGVGKKMTEVAAVISDFPNKVITSFKKAGAALLDEKTFINFYKKIGAGAVEAADMVRTKLGVGFEILKQRIGGATVQLAQFVKNGAGVSKVAAGLKTFFGSFSVALGPIGLIFKLLSPLINMVEKSLTPAFETFSDILENAFAPLSMVAETVARDLAPLVAKFLTPLVNVLTVVLAKAGTFLVKLLDTGKAGGVVSGIFGKLLPIVTKIFDALGGLGAKILPLVGRLFTAMLPIIEKVVTVLGNLAEKVIPIIGDIIEKIGPIVIDTFEKIFEAIEPLIDPLVKLGEVLLEKVFAPLLIKALEGVLALVQKLIPYIQEGVPVVAKIISDVADQVGDFFDNFQKYMKQFSEAFAPEIETLKDFGKAAAQSFGWVLDKLQPLIDGVKKLMSLFGSSDAEKTQKTVEAAAVSGQGAAFHQDEATTARMSEAKIQKEVQERLSKGQSIADLQSAARPGQPKPPGMAEGGIINKDMIVRAGEAGKEAITPLKPEVFQAMLPGLDEAVQYLKVIARAVTGTLNVRGGEASQTAAPRNAAQPPSDLGAGIGITGLATVRA